MLSGIKVQTPFFEEEIYGKKKHIEAVF